MSSSVTMEEVKSAAESAVVSARNLIRLTQTINDGLTTIAAQGGGQASQATNTSSDAIALLNKMLRNQGTNMGSWVDEINAVIAQRHA